MMKLKLLALSAAIIGSTALLAAPKGMADEHGGDRHGGGGGDWHGDHHGGGWHGEHGGGDWHHEGWFDRGRRWHWYHGYGPAYGYYGPPPSVVITPRGIGITP
jgi:hypothetical protein